MATLASQLPLFGDASPRFDAELAVLERTELRDGAWVDLARGWLAGEAWLFEQLRTTVAWRSEDRKMYDRVVTVPRQLAVLGRQGRPPEVVERMRLALSARYDTDFNRVSAALYRDGSDSVAWHGDTIARRLPEALVATVSLGAPRRFLLRPAGGGASTAFQLGWGDLIVMGGTCQRTYRHCVPKVRRAAPRIALMFRPTWAATESPPPDGRTTRD